MWNSKKMKGSLRLWILCSPVPAGGFRTSPLWTQADIAACAAARKMFPAMVTPNQVYAFAVENWEGVRANIEDIIESLPSPLDHDHELSPHFGCFSEGSQTQCVKRMAHPGGFGTVFLMTLKFWVANRKIWKHRWCFYVFFHVMAMTIERREALRTSGCRCWWHFKRFFWTVSYRTKIMDFWHGQSASCKDRGGCALAENVIDLSRRI